MLRIVSLTVLAAVVGISSSRLVCWLPCALPLPAQEGAAAHCGHVADESIQRLSEGERRCDSCEQLRLTDADRLKSRATLDNANVGARPSPYSQLTSPPAPPHQAEPTPPDRRSSAPVPLPLRI